MQKAVRKYLKALEAGDADKAGALFIADGWVQSPFLGKIPVRDYVRKVAGASSSTALTVHDVLVSAEGHMRAVAYYLYDWQLKDGSKVSFTAGNSGLDLKRRPDLRSPYCYNLKCSFNSWIRTDRFESVDITVLYY